MASAPDGIPSGSSPAVLASQPCAERRFCLFGPDSIHYVAAKLLCHGLPPTYLGEIQYSTPGFMFESLCLLHGV
jgi:hypothetical protein